MSWFDSEKECDNCKHALKVFVDECANPKEIIHYHCPNCGECEQELMDDELLIQAQCGGMNCN